MMNVAPLAGAPLRLCHLLWSLLFIGLRSPILRLIDIIGLWAVLVWLQVTLFRLDRVAACLCCLTCFGSASPPPLTSRSGG